MICEKCKKEIPEESKVCPFCGYEGDSPDKADTVTTEVPTQHEAAASEQNTTQEESQPTPEPLSMAGMPPVQQPEKKRNKKLKIGIIAAAVLLFLAIAIPVSLTVIKTYNYNQAVELLKAEKYEQAKKIFTKLDKYKDSEKNVMECDNGISYDKAVALIGKEDYKGAQEILRDLVEEQYQDSVELNKLCENKQAYQAAQELLDSGAYYDAYTAFQEIMDFEDAAEKAQSCVQPLPATGELYRNEAFAGTTCPIEISRTAASETFPLVLKITTTDDTAVSTVFLAAGEGYTLNLPTGSYKIKILMGVSQWFGLEEMFGDLSFERQMDSGENDGLYVLENNYTYTLSL